MKNRLLLYFAVMAENNFITSYASNICKVIYRKCRGTQFKFGLSSTPHCFFKVRFLETFHLVRQLIEKSGYNCSYIIRKYFVTFGSFDTQNKELNLGIKLHYLEVMEVSLIFEQMFYAKNYHATTLLHFRSSLELQLQQSFSC